MLSDFTSRNLFLVGKNHGEATLLFIYLFIYLFEGFFFSFVVFVFLDWPTDHENKAHACLAETLFLASRNLVCSTNFTKFVESVNYWPWGVIHPSKSKQGGPLPRFGCREVSTLCKGYFCLFPFFKTARTERVGFIPRTWCKYLPHWITRRKCHLSDLY